MTKVISADIGGSHVSVAAIDLDDDQIIPGTFVRKEVDSKGATADILANWVAALEKSAELSGCKLKRVSLAVPGPFDYENGISYIKGVQKYESLYGTNIKEYLSSRLNIPLENVRFRNDAEAAIAGEVHAGAGKGFHNVMGITLGTGFGSAHFFDGVANDLNLYCQPFKNSIADDYFSTRWFLRRYHELTGLSAMGVKHLSEMTASSASAKNIFREFGRNLSDFLSGHLTQINPDVLILCGNIAKSSGLFKPNMERKLKTRIVTGHLGEHAALFGAAALF